VQAFGDEALQPFGRQRNGVGPRDADGVEAECARFPLQRRLEFERVDLVAPSPLAGEGWGGG
jgi:hypothetical protein